MSKVFQEMIRVFLISIVLISCAEDKNKKIEENLANESQQKMDQLKRDFNKAKQVFYSLPSPIETAMLIKRSGVTYNPELLNPIENQNNYVSTYDLALNLGVYSANLSYASMFNQSQTTVKYMGTAKIMADELGILNAIDEGTVRRLENNINNRDSIMDIISETFMNSDVFLKENGRPEVAALMITGGWIEGLYMATQFAEESPENEEITDRITDQKLSLNSLIQLMESYKGDKNVEKALQHLYVIEKQFAEIKMVSSDIKPVTSVEESKTLLTAKTDVYHDKELIKKLTFTVDSIRSSIVNPVTN